MLARTRMQPGTQPFQRALRGVGQPLADRVERPGPGQYPRGRHRQHPWQPVAHTSGISRVRDCGQGLQQARLLGAA